MTPLFLFSVCGIALFYPAISIAFAPSGCDHGLPRGEVVTPRPLAHLPGPALMPPDARSRLWQR